MNKYQYICENYKKPKPILFNTEMVRAILGGRKTQTRRPIKGYGNNYHVNKLLGEWALSGEPEIIKNKEELYLPTKFNEDKFALEWELQTEVDDSATFYIRLPYQPGEILYVRETWQESEYFDYDIKGKIMYRANEGDEEFADLYNVNWRPSIHMPKEASRIFLKVTDVRVERVQGITEKEVTTEGFRDTLDGNIFTTAGHSFKKTWDNIYKSKGYGWNLNPWVWVIEFEKMNIEKS